MRGSGERDRQIDREKEIGGKRVKRYTEEERKRGIGDI